MSESFFLFLLWPLFARAPCHWPLDFFLLSSPGVQNCFCCCAPLGAATFRRGQSKKKTPPWEFFFLAPAPAKGRGRRSPVGRRHGARAKKTKKHHLGARAKRGHTLAPNGASPSPAFRRGRSKKTAWVVLFFLLWPRRKVAAPNGAQQKKHFAHPGTTTSKNLQTNDTRHEQKGATTKENTLAELDLCAGTLMSDGFQMESRLDQSISNMRHLMPGIGNSRHENRGRFGSGLTVVGLILSLGL